MATSSASRLASVLPISARQRPYPTPEWRAAEFASSITLCATLVVGLAAHHCGAPDLCLSPTRVLAHYLPVERG